LFTFLLRSPLPQDSLFPPSFTSLSPPPLSFYIKYLLIFPFPFPFSFSPLFFLPMLGFSFLLKFFLPRSISPFSRSRYPCHQPSGQLAPFFQDNIKRDSSFQVVGPVKIFLSIFSEKKDGWFTPSKRSA